MGEKNGIQRGKELIYADGEVLIDFHRKRGYLSWDEGKSLDKRE